MPPPAPSSRAAAALTPPGGGGISSLGVGVHLRIEVGQWWLQVGRDDSRQSDPDAPEIVTDHPQPATVYVPEQGVGFYRLPDETDRG